MKKILLSFITLSCLSFVQSQKVDVSNSTVEWVGYNIKGQHNGVIQLKSGGLKFENEVLVGGSFVMDMTSIEVTDLTGTGKVRLESHLKSDDFFGVEQFPDAKMTITKVSVKDTGYLVTGDFTIKDTTHPINFVFNVEDKMASAKLKIDRSKFNVRFRSGSFFDNLGDKLIYDEFDINVTLNF